MVWWNETILGGDLPHDIQSNLVVDVCGIDYGDFLDLPITSFKHTFNKRTVEMVDHIESKCADDERNIAYQVLGTMMMAAGSNVPDDLRTLVKNAANNDEWAAEGNEKREDRMVDLVQAMRSYGNGTPFNLLEASFDD